jgi:L-lactate dehydrogenase (cytochrome)
MNDTLRDKSAVTLIGLPDAAQMDIKRHAKRPLAWHLGNLEAAARRRLPRPIFDYVEGGSFGEITCKANRADLDALKLRQRVLSDAGPRSLRSTIAGQTARLPVALAPIGFTGLVYPRGEIHAGRAAQNFGVPFCLSTFSISSLEEVAEALADPFLFQLYLFKDQAVNRELMQRAEQAGCPALVLTLDTAVQARRNRDCDNGLIVPLRVRPRHVIEMLGKPRWTFGWLSSKRTLGNLARFVPGSSELSDCSIWAECNYKGVVHAADLEWVREQWRGKLVIKGILDPEDARTAVKLGADAIVVSNHGGRQLDCAETPVRAFPAIRDAVGDKVELLFDSGIRSGLDVLKALGLGAGACLLGRAYLYGLAAYGEKGVTAVLQLIEQELDAAMALTGVDDAARVPQGVVIGPAMA